MAKRPGTGSWARRVIAAGIVSLLAAAAPRAANGNDPAPPFFPDDFEAAEAAARGLRQKYHEGILITGSPPYIASVTRAMERIAEVDSRNWYFVRKHIRRVTETGHIGMDVAGGRFTSRQPGGGIEVLAGQLVHDAWHRELFLAEKSWVGRDAEAFCIQRQNEFLARAGLPPVDLEAALAAAYWTVDYWSRDW